MNIQTTDYDALDKFGLKLLDKLKSAQQARKNSGIEQIWQEDLEFYSGIDDANRGEVKSRTKDDLDWRSGNSASHLQGSTVFLNITRPYVDHASASLIDMLLPIEELPFDIKPTPVPALQDMAKLKDLTLQAPEGERNVAESAQKILDESVKKAEKAQLRIEDWLIECSWNAELRKVLKDAIKMGTGVLKGPIPVKTKSQKLTHLEHENGIKLEIIIETKPASRRIDPRNLFPDPACGDDIHNGGFIFEKEKMTGRQLKKLIGTPGMSGQNYYLDSQIKRILKEGPEKIYQEKQKTENDNDKYTIWHYYGTATQEDLLAAGVEIEDPQSMTYDVSVMMVNGRVIKSALSTLDSGQFPYDVMTYQPKDDHWTGISLARQIREPQRILNAGIRNILDNAGIGGSPMLVLAEGVEMEDGSPIKIGKHTILRISPDSPIQNAQQAVQPIVIPIISNELLAIIQFAQKMAEDVTGMPLMLQGQQGSAPDTVGGMQILQSNSSAPRRAIAKLFDDKIIIPHIRRFYEWLLLYGDHDDEKGDFQIAAKGSTTFFERDASKMALMQMGNMLSNPGFGINPAKYMREVLKSHRIDADKLLYSEEELSKMQEQAPQQPQDPSLQIAQLRSQTDMQKAQLQQQAMQQEMQLKLQLEQAKIQFDQESQSKQRDLELQLAMISREIKMMELSQNANISLSEIKSQLTQTAQKLNVQTALSKQQATKKTNQALTPPTEPLGRADNGRAFEQ